MAAQKGKELILNIHDGLAYVTVGGFRSNNFTINGETVDITNKGSSDYRELMSTGGLRSISTSASGVFVDKITFLLAHTHVLAGSHADCQIIVPGLGEYTGNFIISSLDMSGEHNGEVSYSLSLDSAGFITFTPLP